MVANEEPPGDDPVPGPKNDRFALAAHPNPFNPQTTVTFTLQKPARVDVAVYDIQGRRLCAIASGEYPAGSNEVTWQGRDTAGREVPSGTYFVHCRTDDLAISRKVTLLR